MIELGQDAAVLVVGLWAVAAVGWSSYVSVRSAAAGPAWALAHLARLRPVWIALAAVGLAALVAFSPIWTGMGILYVLAAVVFLSSTLRKSLMRLEALEGFDELPLERRMRIVGRARRLLLILGLVLAGLGGWALAVSAGSVAWIVVALGATLVGTAGLLARGSAADGRVR